MDSLRFVVPGKQVYLLFSAGMVCLFQRETKAAGLECCHIAIKKNLLLYRISTYTRIINDKKPFSPGLLQETYVVDIC